MHEIFLILVTSVIPHRGNAYRWQHLRGNECFRAWVSKDTPGGEVRERDFQAARPHGRAAGDSRKGGSSLPEGGDLMGPLQLCDHEYKAFAQILVQSGST